MASFFTSDLHFGCRDVYKEYAHPFSTYDAYVQAVINNINAICTPRDSLYIVGDLVDYENRFFRDKYWQEAFEAVKQIDCKIKLVLGNNERRLIRDCFNNSETDFEEFLKQRDIESLGYSRVVRFGGALWNFTHRLVDARRDMLNMYGHQHRESSLTSAGINTSIALTGYYPLSERQLMMLVWRSCDYTIRAKQLPIVPGHDTALWYDCEKIWHKYIKEILPYA